MYIKYLLIALIILFTIPAAILLIWIYKIRKDQKKSKKIINYLNSKAYNEIHVTPNTVFAFDIDRVILTLDFKEVIKTILKAPNKIKLIKFLIKSHFLIKVWFDTSPHPLTADLFVDQLLKQYPKEKEVIDIIYALTNTKKNIKPICALIKELHDKGHKLVILSNQSQKDIEFTRDKHPIFKYFSHFFLTTPEDNYVRKPSTLFFEKFLRSMHNMKVEPKDIIFIDDNFRNVISADSIGIPSIVYTNIDELRKILFK